MIQTNSLQTLTGLCMTAYGVDISSKDSKDFKSPVAFDAYDLWLGDDYDYFLDNLLDRFFDEIEADLKSVWSSNLSEQESAQASAQRSADASALGMTDDGSRSGDGGSGFTGSGVSATEDAAPSSNSSALSEQSLDHDLSDHSGYKHGHFHHPLESRRSGTASSNQSGDTQDSISEGTSGSVVSTQSIILVPYANIYENANTSGTSTRSEIVILSKSAGDLAGKSAFRKATGTGLPGALAWTGDADNEYIFGTSWADTLSGGMGNDILYGYEADDTIEGGYGADRLFGDAGDDIMFGDTAAQHAARAVDDIANFMSGGSGNDKMYGGGGDRDVMFGGPGHDFMYPGLGSAFADGIRMYGEDGDDEMHASIYGNN